MPKKKTKPGPEAQRLKIEGNWRVAVRKAVNVERPEGGWPDESDPDKKPAKRPRKRRKPA